MIAKDSRSGRGTGLARHAPLAGAGLSLGLVLTVVDQVWGNRNGMFALSLLAVGVAAALAFEFLDHRRTLKYPRRLDALFVAGADYRRRQDQVKSAVLASARKLSFLSVIAGTLILILHMGHPARLALLPGLLVLEVASVSACFWLIAERGWLSPSQEKSSASLPHTSWQGTGNPGPAWLRRSGSIAAFLTGALPSPYAWLLRRKLLFLLRLDPVFLGIYLAALPICGLAFKSAGALFLLGFFALIGCMLTLTLAQSAWTECDRFQREQAYLFPGRELGFRCDLGVALGIATAFGLYFSLGASLQTGMLAALRSQALWQTWATLWAFAGLVIADAYAAGRSRESRTLLSFSYLGIAGILFMFPGYGVLAASAALLGAGFQCFRLARSERRV